MLHQVLCMAGLAVALAAGVITGGPGTRPGERGGGGNAAAKANAAPAAPQPDAAVADDEQDARDDARDDGAAAAAPAGEKPAPRLKAREMKPAPAGAADAPDRPAGRAGYLGIVTGAVPEELRAHLELPDQAGLVITKVAPGSPASRAGLEANDILLDFAGRDVASPLELSEMIQATKGGTRVRLGIVRRGKRRHVDAVIEARDAVAGEDGRAAAGPPGMQPGNLAGLPPQLQAQLLQQQLLQGQFGAAIAQGLAQAQAQVGGGPGGTQLQTSTVTINGRTHTTTVASDAQGTVELRAADGKRSIAIRDATGKQVHAGPLDREADYKAIPEFWRQKVRDVEARSRGVPAGVLGGAGNAL